MNTLFGLERMVPFTAEVLASLHAGINIDLWPLRLLGLAMALAVVVRVWRYRPPDDRFTATVLTIFWLWNGLAYMGHYRAELDWAAPGYGLLFVVEGALLTWFGIVRPRIGFDRAGRSARAMGGMMAVFALVALPLLTWFVTGDPEGAETVGLLPTPTTVFTLGVLVMVGIGAPRILFLLPLVWSAVGGALGWVSGSWLELCLPLAGALALIALFRSGDPAD